MFLGPWPITSSPLLQKRSRSKGPFLHRHYPASRVVCPSPTPAQASNQNTVTGRDPVPGTGLPRYSSYLPGMLSSVPRQIRMGANDGCFSILHRPSPNIGRVGFYNCPFGAFSRFTRVTACQVAAALAAYICPRGFSRKVSLSHCLGSYRDEPTISRAGLPPAGDLRLRGAPIYCAPFCLDIQC